MGWTKRELINAAFDEAGIADYEFDLTADQLQFACQKMDAMVASWTGINLGYNSSDTPGTADIDADSGVPPFANAAIYLNLALKLLRGLRLPATPDLLGEARIAYSKALSLAMDLPIPRQMPSTLPRGAGQKAYDFPFVTPPSEVITNITGGDELDFIN